jgi:hypothetical protein
VWNNEASVSIITLEATVDLLQLLYLCLVLWVQLLHQKVLELKHK